MGTGIEIDHLILKLFKRPWTVAAIFTKISFFQQKILLLEKNRPQSTESVLEIKRF
jgi:hypothetical protein